MKLRNSLLLLVVGVAVASLADVYTWTGGAGNHAFSEPANWDLGSTPADGDALVLPTGESVTFHQDLGAFAPRSLVVTNAVHTTGTYNIALDGSPFVVGEGGFTVEIDLLTGSLFPGNGLTGTGTFTFGGPRPLAPNYVVYAARDWAAAFAGPVVLRNSGGLEIAARATRLGDDDPSTVIPDAITLGGLSSIKNYQGDLLIPSWQGVRLVDGGGGFCCGWVTADSPNRAITVDGPITGDGRLYIARAAGLVQLNSSQNAWTGGTEIGSTNAFAYAAGSPTRVVLGPDAAFPQGGELVVGAWGAADFDLNGHDLTVDTLKLMSGSVIRNSSETPVTVTFKDGILWGSFEGAITLDYDPDAVEVLVEDDKPWVGNFFEVPAGTSVEVAGMRTGGLAYKLTGGTLSLPATAGFGLRRDGSYFNTKRMRGLDGVVASAEMGATAAGWAEYTTYYYQGLWKIPATATYHFAKSFDDAARLVIDGQVVLSSTSVNEVPTVDVLLEEGWHDVGVWFGNAGVGAGPRNSYKSGLVWGTADTDLKSAGHAFDTAEGTFAFLSLINQPLHYGAGGGTVQVVGDATLTDGTPALYIEGGILAEADAGADDAVTLKDDTIIGVKDARHVAVFDANVVMAAGKTLTFQGDVLLKRRPPAGYRLAPDTVVYLTEATIDLRAEVVAAGAKLGYASFNLSAYGDAVTLAAGETLVAKSSVNTLGYEPLVNDTTADDAKTVCQAAFTVPEGATLEFDNAAPWRQEGTISGDGLVRTVYGTVNFTADNSSFAGTFYCKGAAHFATTASAGAVQATVYVAGPVTLDTADLFPQTFVTAGGRFAEYKSREAHIAMLVVDPDHPVVTVDVPQLFVSASGFSPADSVALEGTGQFVLDVNIEAYQLPVFTGAGSLGLTGTGSVNVLSLGGFSGTFAALSPTVRLRFESQMAPDPAFWLDASRAETLTMLDAEQIDAWRDARDGASGARYPACYRTNVMTGWINAKNCNPATLLKDDTLVPGQCVDFGTYHSGKWFAFTAPVQAQTIFYVINSRNGGGGCFFSYSKGEKGIVRNASVDDATIPASAGLYNSQAWANPVFATSTSRMNGEPCSSTSKGLSGGWDVVSTRLASAQTLDALAKDVRPLTGGHADGNKRAGGMAYAEVLIYDRALTDAEIAETEAYLMSKWMARSTGAAAGLNGSLTVTMPTTVEVAAANDAAYVDSLKGESTLTKTGAGSLWVKNMNGFDGTVAVAEGDLTLGMTLPSPAFWVDANTQTGTDEEGKFFWRDCRWDGETDYIVAKQRWTTAPTLLANACASLSVVDFGPLSTWHDRGLQWSRTVKAQTMFLVIGSQNSGGTILGTSDNDCVFNRGNMTKASDPLYYQYTNTSIQKGTTRLDGVVVDGLKTGFNGGYQVLSVRATAPVSVGQFAHDRNLEATKTRDGGQRLGEVLIFEESLTDAQIALVESYLQKKWFAGETTRTILSSVGEATQEAASLEIAGAGTTLSTIAQSQTRVQNLAGAADVTLNGAGSLAVLDAHAYTGTVTVAAGGRLALPGLAATALADATFWVDASATDSLEFAGEDSLEVTRWNDVRGNGRYAARAADEAQGSYPNLNPVLLKEELNGRDVLDFGEWMGNRFLVFDRPIHNIRTVFWVIGSQAGGGLLLGYSGDTSIRDFYRAGGGDGSDWSSITAANPLWTRTVQGPVLAVADAPTRLNGADVDGCAVGLSGAYDLVSVRTTGNVRASAFGMDRDRKYRNATGGQRLAEVIIFQRALSSDETTAIEQYLARKWGQSVVHAQPVVDAGASLSVDLAQGDLSLTPYGTYALGTVGGIGAVQGSGAAFTVAGLHNAATDDPAAALAVAAEQMTVAANATWTVDVDSRAAPIRAQKVVFAGGGTLVVNRAAGGSFEPLLLLQADALEGFNPLQWRVQRAGGPSYRLAPHEDGIYLELSQGLHLIFR